MIIIIVCLFVWEMVLFMVANVILLCRILVILLDRKLIVVKRVVRLVYKQRQSEDILCFCSAFDTS